MHTTDRDLLAREPRLLDDATLVSQTLITVTDANVSGSTLTSASADFEAVGIDVGHLIIINSVPCEVLARVDANTLTVSKLRALTADVSIPPGDGSSLAASVITFAPQRQLASDELLNILNRFLDLDEPFTADDIVSTSQMQQLEALHALSLIYASAATVSDEQFDRYQTKATQHQTAFRNAWRSAAIVIDTNSDGVGDRIIHPARLQLQRA